MKRRHGSGFGDAFFQNLPVYILPIRQQHVGIMRRVLLAFVRVDANLLDCRLHAEGAGFVGHDGDDEFADRRILHQSAQNSDKAPGGGDGATLGAGEPFVEEIQLRRFEGRLGNFALGKWTTERGAARLQVLHRRIAWIGTIEIRMLGGVSRQRNVEMLHEVRQALVGQLLFRVGRVASLRRTQPIALDGFGQDDGRAALVFDGAFVGVINLRRDRGRRDAA